MKDLGDFSKETPEGSNLHFGVRELAMAAIGNGIRLHGGLRSFVSTFFVFSDYVKPMARLSALMQLPLTYVLTHDSIGVGEDGPTHQPIEQLAMFRAMPNFYIFRPADAAETAAAWYYALNSKSAPVAMVLSRQNLPQLAEDGREALKGAYILKDSTKETPSLLQPVPRFSLRLRQGRSCFRRASMPALSACPVRIFSWISRQSIRRRYFRQQSRYVLQQKLFLPSAGSVTWALKVRS